MFAALVTRTQSLLSTAEELFPLTEQAYARAALSRISIRHRRSTAAGEFVFLAGPEGIGKSLLVRDTLRHCRHEHPKLVAVVASAAELSELLVMADEQQGLADTLEQFRSVQVLACDDLQDLEGDPLRQDLLLELVELLGQQGTHLIFTSRKLPGELRAFSTRWISRCHGGFCTRLPALSLSSRIDLLTRFSHSYKLPLAQPAEQTLQWLAGSVPASPGELDSLIRRLSEHIRRKPSRIDLAYLEQWLAEDRPAELLSLEIIAAAVAVEFGIDAEDLRSRSRQPGLIVPRQCAMLLAKEFTGRPLESIGQYFGDRAHTTVSHSLSRLKQLLPDAPTLRQQVQRLRQRIIDTKQEDCA